MLAAVLAVAAARVPYAIAGAGAYVWPDYGGDSQLLTGSLGLGATLGAAKRWRVEARWHPVLQNTGGGTKPMLVTVGAGRRFGW